MTSPGSATQPVGGKLKETVEEEVDSFLLSFCEKVDNQEKIASGDDHIGKSDEVERRRMHREFTVL